MIIDQCVQAEQIVFDLKVSWVGNVVDDVRVTNIIWRRETSELSAAVSHELLLVRVLLLTFLVSKDNICVHLFPSKTVIEEVVFPGL